MPVQEKGLNDLRKKYGAEGVDAGMRLSPHDFAEMIGWRDELDQHYTKLWLDYTYGGLYKRGILSDRARLLVAVGQCIALGNMEFLESNIRSALAHASPREVLEVILQSGTYLGMPNMVPAARTFRRVIEELGRLDEITSTQPPIEGDTHGTIEEERPTWSGVSDERFPSREEMLRKYGWRGISCGLRTQPTHHAEAVQRLDKIDQNFLNLWLKLIYEGLYRRGVLDDKTRVLCIIGICTVLDELPQNYNHQRNALMLGASPREVLEVLLHSTFFCGMPRSLRGVGVLERILGDQNRLDELTETQLPLPA